MEKLLRFNRIALIVMVTLLFAPGRTKAQNTLDFYLNAARENNPVVKENLLLKEKAAIQEKKIGAEYHGPKIYATGEANYSPLIPNKDDPKAVGYDVAITDGGLIAANLNVVKPVFNQSVLETLKQQAQASGEAGVVNATLLLHQLEKEVTDQYIVTYQSLAQIEFTKKIREQLLKQKEIIEALAKSGIYNSADILLLDIEIQNQSVQLNDLQSAYNQNIYTLNSQCGISGVPNATLSPPDIQLREDIRQSKFMDKFRSDSLQEVLSLQVSNLKYKPQFNLYGNTGLKAIEFSGIQRKFGAAIGLTVAIPIYDGHQRNYSEQQTQINLQDIDNYRQNFLVQKNNRQQALFSSLGLLDKKIEILTAQIQNYEKLIELYKNGLQAGNIEIINYMNTVRLYTSLQNELSINTTNKFLIINESNYYNW